VEYLTDPDEVREVWPYSPLEVLPVWRLLWAAEDALTEGPEDRAVHPRVVQRLRRLRGRLYWAGCRESGKPLTLPTNDELDEAMIDLHEALKREALAAADSYGVQQRLSNSAKAMRAARAKWDAVMVEDEE
jgi:hypothetical protein